MSRIAIVVQRYGAEINGGAELHARSIARSLRPHYEVDVLTSRALDYRTWEPHYPAGESHLDDCRIIRFDHPTRQGGHGSHTPVNTTLRWTARRWLPLSPLVAKPTGNPRHDGLLRLRARGPTMDGLIDYLRLQGESYNSLIFFTAFYHPSAVGVLVHPGRSLLVPTLHDEKTMYLPHFHGVFRAPRRIMYNTSAEQAVAERLYGKDLAPGEIVGVGIDLPAPSGSAPDQRWAATVARYGIAEPYLLYLGRLDAGKCGSLFENFLRWREERGLGVQLVAVGQSFMEPPHDPAIRYTGFVSTKERDDLIQHAKAMVIPSRKESLSIVLLESLVRGCPVVVNGASEVLSQHVQDSGAGATYHGYQEFKAAVDKVLARSESERAADASRGRKYVEERYSWPVVVEKFRRVIDGS